MNELQQHVTTIIQTLYQQSVEPTITRPEPQFGDYTTNVALQLAGRVGQNSRHIAEAIAAELTATGQYQSVEVAGPGFINITVSPQALLAGLRAPVATPYAGQKLVFEYSCPNAFKELHTGHLYQTIYGDIVARLMEQGGADLQRTSFGGDVGLHVAKCMWGMQALSGGYTPSALAEVPDDAFERARWISRCYVRGASAYEEDPAAKEAIDELNTTIYNLHEQDEHSTPLAQMYWQTRQWSFDYFDAFYKLIDVTPMRYYPESQTSPVGMAEVKRQLAKGNLVESEGAVVFKGDPDRHLHTRVFVTRRGLPTYETKDIGVIWLEMQDYNFDQRYLLTGNDQKEYMRVVYAAAETFRPQLKGAMTHLTNGTVRFADGKKMSSRLGNVSRAADVISAVQRKVAELVQGEEQRRIVTLGAIKYAFARYKLGGDINFDIDETVSLHGNSGPYVQYAHARAQRILEKHGQAPEAIHQVYSEDRALVRKLGEYPQVLSRAITSLEPHYICTYLFELAQEFNRYYEHNQVIGSPKQAHRAGLVAAYAGTLKAGLATLGIQAPNRL